MAAGAGLGIQSANGAQKHTPGRKMSLTRYTTRPPSNMPEFEMVKPPSPGIPIVISVEESRPSTTESSRKTSAEESSGDETANSRPRRPTITIPAKTYTPPLKKMATPANLPPPPATKPPQSRPESPTEAAAAASKAESPYPPRSDSRAGTPKHQSVFPVYDPALSLGQQSYRPTPEIVPALSRMQETSTSAQKPATIVKDRLAPAPHQVKKESPLGRSESVRRPNGYSKPAELLDLWSIANGQPADEAHDTYTLELSCDDLALNSEIITFSSSSAPLYQLAASASDQLNFTRVHPQDRRTQIPICTSTLSRATRQDPLVSSMFPKLAGLLAMDESSTAAVERRLDRQASSLLQADAMQKAQEREASMLLWDSDSGRFCILHPTLLDSTTTVLKIEIQPSPTSPSKITIFAPETDTPLLSLDMPTLALTIHANAIRALPSLYLLDTLMTAMLTLLLHLHRLCADPSSRHSATPPQMEENTPYFPPPPPSLHSKASRRDVNPNPRSASRASAFRSVRSVRSTRSLASTAVNDKDIELGLIDPETGRYERNAAGGNDPTTEGEAPGTEEKFGWGDLKFGKESISGQKKRKAPKGIVDADDPGLPAGTRAALRFLYWVFEVAYWIMGTMVHLLALGVVAMGKFITKL